MAVLGVIAGFTIPKVLHQQQVQKQQAVMRETIAAIENMMRMYVREGPQNMDAFMRKYINAIRFCNDSLAEGCWTADMVATAEANERGFILSNGAYVTGLFANSADWDGFRIDWNGPEPPNQSGQDTYALAACFDPDGCTGGGPFGSLDRNVHYIQIFSE